MLLGHLAFPLPYQLCPTAVTHPRLIYYQVAFSFQLLQPRALDGGLHKRIEPPCLPGNPKETSCCKAEGRDTESGSRCCWSQSDVFLCSVSTSQTGRYFPKYFQLAFLSQTLQEPSLMYSQNHTGIISGLFPFFWDQFPLKLTNSTSSNPAKRARAGKDTKPPVMKAIHFLRLSS